MAKSTTAKPRKTVPTDSEMRAIIENLETHGHPATALLGAAYIDHILENLLAARFIGLNKPEYERMFSPTQNGILGSLVPKIRMAWALDLIGPKTYHDLLLIADIRNNFAHSLYPLSFDDPWVKDQCYELQSVAPAFAKSDDPGSDTAINRFLETVYVAFVFIRQNAKRLAGNKVQPDTSKHERLIKDLL